MSDNTKQLTTMEVNLLLETLEAIEEEIVAVRDTTGYEFTTGIDELLEESNIILQPLAK